MNTQEQNREALIRHIADLDAVIRRRNEQIENQAHNARETQRALEEITRERDEAKSWASRWQEEAEGNEARGDALAAGLAAAVVRADTAEQEYEALKVAYNEQGDALVASYDHPRPLTPDAITDEMVLRFMNSYDEQLGRAKPAPTLNYFTAHRTSVTRNALADALTEPPARPEGAEDIEAAFGTWERAEYLHAALDADDLRSIADHIAEEMNR